MRSTNRLDSVRHAFQGWWYVLRTQRNTWIHALLSISAILAGFWLGVSRLEWAILLLTIATVWVAEFVNTAMEALIDLASPEYHPLAKVGKDVAAAAVLVGALAATLIGLLIFGPPLWAKLSALRPF